MSFVENGSLGVYSYFSEIEDFIEHAQMRLAIGDCVSYEDPAASSSQPNIGRIFKILLEEKSQNVFILINKYDQSITRTNTSFCAKESPKNSDCDFFMLATSKFSFVSLFLIRKKVEVYLKKEGVFNLDSFGASKGKFIFNRFVDLYGDVFVIDTKNVTLILPSESPHYLLFNANDGNFSAKADYLNGTSQSTQLNAFNEFPKAIGRLAENSNCFNCNICRSRLSNISSFLDHSLQFHYYIQGELKSVQPFCMNGIFADQKTKSLAFKQPSSDYPILINANPKAKRSNANSHISKTEVEKFFQRDSSGNMLWYPTPPIFVSTAGKKLSHSLEYILYKVKKRIFESKDEKVTDRTVNETASEVIAQCSNAPSNANDKNHVKDNFINLSKQNNMPFNCTEFLNKIIRSAEA